MAAALVVALVFAAAVSLVTAVAAGTFGRIRREPMGVAFLGVAVSGGLWAAGTAGQLVAPTRTAAQVAGITGWTGVTVLAIAWPVFVLAYTNKTPWLARRRVALLAALPAGTFLASFHPATQSLVLTNPHTEAIGGAMVTTYDPGPLLLTFVAYTTTVNVATLALLALDAWRTHGVRRRRSAALLAAGALPFAVGIASLLHPLSFDFTPVAFSATSVLVGYAILRYDLLDLAPHAERLLVESLGDGYLVVDQFGAVASANDTAAAILGTDAVRPGSDATEVLAAYPELRTAVATGRTLTRELVVEPDDVDAETDALDPGPDAVDDDHTISSLDDANDVAVYEAHVRPFDAAGVDGSVVLFRNVTDPRRGEKRAAALLDRTTTAISILDADGTIRYANPAHETMLGYDPVDLLGRNAFDLVHPDDQHAIRTIFQRAAAAEETVEVEFRLHDADAEWRILSATGEPRFDDPFIQGMVVASTDVTTDRRTRTRLQVVNRVLRHDLRNSVNAITGYVDLLAERADSPDADEYAALVRDRTEDLLDLSEKARLVDESAKHPERSVIDVADHVAHAVDDVRDAHPDATLTFDASDAADARAAVTPLIDAAFENVVENAVEHNDQPHPRVGVTVAADGEFVTVTVTDDGPSIPNADRRAIETGAETPLEHASGFGLWLANWLAQESGGTLTIEDNDPRGNVVTIRLPRADAEPTAARDATANPPED